jgi:SPOR domain
MKIFFITILVFFTFNVAYCQADSLSNIEEVKDYRINILNKTYKSSYKLKGYRVQIYSGNKKQPAKQARARFIQKHKKIEAYVLTKLPYFKVRVGDFKTKLEALKFQKKLTKDFPHSFIVNDDIEFKGVKN